MSITVRLETSTLTRKHQSGVSQYTQLLKSALTKNPRINLTTTNTPSLINRIYTKIQSHNYAPPFDIFRSKVDLTIFPDFSTWPTIRSRYTATVIHDLTYLYFPELVEEKNLAHLRRVVPRSIKRSNLIITVSESVKKELVKEFNLNPDNCIVTPIPPDESFFKTFSVKEINEAKNKYGIKEGQKYIYFIGNLEPRKNLKTLIAAYQLLPKVIKDEYALILAGGKGWKTEETTKALDTAVAHGENIRHLGFIDQQDSPALYQGASLFVMPSLYEGFGMPVLEAMASGTPVVASNIPVLKEVGGDYAHYAEALDAQDFANKITSVLQTPKPKRSELQKNVQRYSWHDNVEEIIKKVESLNEPPRTRSKKNS